MFKGFCTFWWSTWVYTAYSVIMKSVMLLPNYLYFPAIKVKVSIFYFLVLKVVIIKSCIHVCFV